MSTTVPLRKGAGGGSPELIVGRTIEIHLSKLLKEPLLVRENEVAGWCPSATQFDPDLAQAWKRILEIQALPSNPSSGTFDLALFFKSPQTLPRPRAFAYQSLGVTRREFRKGITFDVANLQVDDLEAAGRALSKEGIPGYSSFTEAMQVLVGVEKNPAQAREILAGRLAKRRAAFRKARWLTLFIPFAYSARILVENPSPRAAVAAAVSFGISVLFMVTFSGVYRLARFGISAPEGGRTHRSVMVLLTPIFVAGLGALVALAKVCPCGDEPAIRLAEQLGWVTWGIAGILTLFGQWGMKATDGPPPRKA